MRERGARGRAAALVLLALSPLALAQDSPAAGWTQPGGRRHLIERRIDEAAAEPAGEEGRA